MYTLTLISVKIYLEEGSENMILFFKSFFNTLLTLSWVDIVFFVAVVFLIILVVSLLYFIMINNEDEVKKDIKVPKKEEVKVVPKETNIFEDPNEEDEALIDLTSLTKKLENKETKVVNLTDYEEEQEKKAIISYDELLEKTKDLKLDYEDEEKIGDVTVKKVDLEKLSSLDNEPEPINKGRVISYEKEEAFLEALKKLQEQIN